jgi:hypothetical protein
MEIGRPKCCEGLKFIAKSTGTERFSSRQTPAAFLYSACTSWLPLPRATALVLGGGGLPALTGGVWLNLISSAAVRHSSNE